jgi:hypothetical protein
VSREEVRIRIANNPFLREEAKDPARLAALRAACAAVLGSEPPVELEVAQGEAESPLHREHIERAAREHDRKREAAEHDTVRAALSEFEGARLRGVRLVDKE